MISTRFMRVAPLYVIVQDSAGYAATVTPPDIETEYA